MLNFSPGLEQGESCLLPVCRKSRGPGQPHNPTCVELIPHGMESSGSCLGGGGVPVIRKTGIFQP